jgi:endonuclease G
MYADTRLKRYNVGTVDSVERAAGLMLFSPQVKASAKELCRETRCEVIVRRFDDARKQTKGKGGRS